MKYILMTILAVAVLASMASAQSTGVLTQYCGNVNALGANAIVNTTAPWYCTNINGAAETAFSKWIPIAYAVTLLSFMIAVALIMFGIALRQDRVRIFGTGELYEAIATAIMVLLFTFVAAEMFGLLPGFFAGAEDPFSISLYYIYHTISATSTLIIQYYQIATVDYFYAGQTVNVCLLQSQFQCVVGPFALFSPIYKYSVLYGFFWPAYVTLDLMLGGFMALHLEFYTILLLMYSAIPVFLIPGILFRAFLPTRNIGGMMMAIAIGFYFFMPILFSIAYYFTNQGYLTPIQEASAALSKYGGCVPGAATCPDAVENSISPTSPLIGAIATTNSALNSFWLSVLFFPAIISGMTYAFITQVGELLGGMAKTSARLRGL